MSTKIRKIMVTNVVTVESASTVKGAAEMMNKYQISCLVVVEDGKPVGIVTERDMLNRVINMLRAPEKTTVEEIMSKPLVVASPEMRAGDAAKLMLEQNLKKLPVVEDGKLVGIVALTDLIRVEGVFKFLNGVALNGAPNHVKKAVSLYIDSKGIGRRKCPLNMKDGFSLGCMDHKCMWWAGDECAVTKLSRNIENVQTGECESEIEVSEI